MHFWRYARGNLRMIVHRNSICIEITFLKGLPKTNIKAIITPMNRDTKLFIELLARLTETELQSRYKNTVFGFVWIVANPLLQMLIIGFIFPLFIKEPIKNYNYFLFIGLLVWNFFSLSLSKSTPSIVYERSLIKKASFPRAVIPLSIIMSNLIHFLAALALFVISTITIGTMTLYSLPYSVIAIVLLCIFTSGISLLTSALNTRYRDINFFVSALLIVWFYASPIVYPLTQMPSKYIWLWRLNPLTSIIQLLQHAFVGTALPGPLMIVSNCIVIGIMFALGIYIFIQESKNFDDWI